MPSHRMRFSSLRKLALLTGFLLLAWTPPVLAQQAPVTSAGAGRSDDSQQASEAACASGKPVECMLLGARYEGGVWGKPDLVRAVSAYQRGCEAGGSCRSLTNLLIRGVQVSPEDVPRTLFVLESACQRKDAMACLGLAIVYKDGQLTPFNPFLAVFFAEKACDLKSREGCSGARIINIEGLRAASTPEHWLELAKKGCELRDAMACEIAGEMLETGKEVAKDLAQAAKYFQQACQLGESLGCQALKP